MCWGLGRAVIGREKGLETKFFGFTVKHDGPASQILATGITIYKAFDPGEGPRDRPFVKTSAIWDTGANQSVVSKKIADKLKLIPQGPTGIQSVNSKQRYEVETYLANITVPGGLSFSNIVMSELAPNMRFPHFSFGALIGMDIIGQGDFYVCRRSGETFVNFWLPNTHELRLKSPSRLRLSPADLGKGLALTGQPIVGEGPLNSAGAAPNWEPAISR